MHTFPENLQYGCTFPVPSSINPEGDGKHIPSPMSVHTLSVFGLCVFFNLLKFVFFLMLLFLESNTDVEAENLYNVAAHRFVENTHPLKGAECTSLIFMLVFSYSFPFKGYIPPDKFL